MKHGSIDWRFALHNNPLEVFELRELRRRHRDVAAVMKDCHSVGVSPQAFEKRQRVRVQKLFGIVSLEQRECDRCRQQREQVERVRGGNRVIERVVFRWPKHVEKEFPSMRLKHGKSPTPTRMSREMRWAFGQR